MRPSRKDKKTAFLKKVLNELFIRVGFDGYDQKLVDKYPNNWYVQRENGRRLRQMVDRLAGSRLLLSIECKAHITDLRVNPTDQRGTAFRGITPPFL